MEVLSNFPGTRRRRARRAAGRVAAFGIVIASASCLAASPPMDEYQVKAAFIYNFAKFVQWPVDAFKGPSDPISICVLGQDPFGSSLGDTVANRSIDGRSLIIRHLANIKQVVGCHVLFIGSAEDKRLPSTVADIRATGVLTIGDSDFSGVDGVVINFKLEGGKVRFDINVDAAEREKLRISSRLLSLAHVVESNRK
jgi:hypothetical protein